MRFHDMEKIGVWFVSEAVVMGHAQGKAGGIGGSGHGLDPALTNVVGKDAAKVTVFLPQGEIIGVEGFPQGGGKFDFRFHDRENR